jgi:hypothetical protein
MHGDGPVAGFAPAVPANASVVVRTKASTRVLYVLLLACTMLLVAVLAGLVALGVWLGAAALPLLVVLPLLAVQLGFTVLVVREYRGLLGPQLAADHTGVWVRTGLGARPEVVYLPWAAVEGVDTHKGPVVRIMSRAGEGLFDRRPHWRVRSLRRRFGTAFVVDGRRAAEPVDRIAHRLHQTASSSRSEQVPPIGS